MTSEIVSSLKTRSEAEIAECEAGEQRKRQADRRKAFRNQVGRRYVECTLDNYEATDAKQRSVLDRLRVYAEQLPKHVSAGHGLILYGPVGTGKDHLMAALLRIVASRGIAYYRWVSGLDLHGRMRDRISRRELDCNEEALIREFTSSGVLALSDPIPPEGKLSDFNIQTLYRIIDARYRDCLPTWVTINVKTSEETSDLLSAPIFDRLRHDSLALFCDWPSYRKSLSEV